MHSKGQEYGTIQFLFVPSGNTGQRAAHRLADLVGSTAVVLLNLCPHKHVWVKTDCDGLAGELDPTVSAGK